MECMSSWSDTAVPRCAGSVPHASPGLVTNLEKLWLMALTPSRNPNNSKHRHYNIGPLLSSYVISHKTRFAENVSLSIDICFLLLSL